MTFQVIYKREYPLVQIGIKRAEMPLNDFLDTAETIRSLELEYNHMKMELNEEHSTLYDLLQKARDPRHEISTVVDKGPDGKELFYSNRILLERLKLINSRGYITEIANKILQNGTKLNSSHPDGSTRVVITYTELLSRNSPQETKQFLTSEELGAMDLEAPHFETGRLYMNEAGRQLFGRTLGRRRREE